MIMCNQTRDCLIYAIHLYTPLSAIPFGLCDVLILGTAALGLAIAYRAGER